MKLVTLLAEHLPAWPEGAVIICQDGDGFIKACRGDLAYHAYDQTWTNNCHQAPDIVELYNIKGADGFWCRLFPLLDEEAEEVAAYLRVVAEDFYEAKVTPTQWQAEVERLESEGQHGD